MNKSSARNVAPDGRRQPVGETPDDPTAAFLLDKVDDGELADRVRDTMDPLWCSMSEAEQSACKTDKM